MHLLRLSSAVKVTKVENIHIKMKEKNLVTLAKFFFFICLRKNSFFALVVFYKNIYMGIKSTDKGEVGYNIYMCKLSQWTCQLSSSRILFPLICY